MMPAMHQLISVILPVHNAGHYFQQALTSVLQQSYENFELIIVDDHSDDHALDWLPNDPRIRLIQSKTQGLVGALNSGLEIAQGDFFARMDADDINHSQRFEQQLRFLQTHKDIDICSCKIKIFSEYQTLGQGYRLYQQWLNQQLNHEQIERAMFIESPIVHPSIMMPMERAKQIAPYQQNAWPEDYDFWLRALDKAYRFAKVEQTLFYWRDHLQRLTRTDKRYDKKSFFKIKAKHLAKRLSYHNNIFIWGTGPTGLLLHDELCKNQINIQGFIDVHPRRIGQHKRDKPVLDIESGVKTADFILVAVAHRGIREKINEYLLSNKKQAMLDFVHCA